VRLIFLVVMKSILIILLGLALFLGNTDEADAKKIKRPQPTIQSLLKANIYQELVRNREIVTHAAFEDKKNLKKDHSYYEFYVSMMVRADYGLARKLLLDAEIYARLVPLVDKASWNKKTRVLDIAGGVMGYRMHSQILFIEESENWLSFTFIGGTFTGMKGTILFEDRGEKGTLVYFGGHHSSRRWPPKIVMTLGGEIAMSVTGRSMRKYIETQNKPGRIKKNEPRQKKFPQPRGYIQRKH